MGWIGIVRPDTADGNRYVVQFEIKEMNVTSLLRPTHHSTGPAQKAAQAGEFRRYASLNLYGAHC